MNQHHLHPALKFRYATQKFDLSKLISEQDLFYILEVGNLMPTSYGLQPFRFVVVQNQEMRNALVIHSYGQEHVAKNSSLIVLAARTDIDEAMIEEYTSRIENTRGLPPGSADELKTMMINDLCQRSDEARLLWAKQQAYIALGGMIAAASELGIDNHALEGFDPDAFDSLLGLKTRHLRAAVLLALGYRAPDDEWQHYQKVRVSIDSMVIRL